MPYSGEFANKSAHFDIIKNRDVKDFLEQCTYLTPPSEEQGNLIGTKFQEAPNITNVELPQKVISIDGSRYEASIDNYLPSTKVGYIKVSSVLIDLSEFDNLRVEGGRFVDPFKVAKLREGISPLAFALPSANIQWSGKSTVQHGFRAAVDASLYDNKTRFNPNDPKSSLRTTLFYLASIRSGDLGTNSVESLKIHKCPNCEKGPIELKDIPDQQYCPCCNAEVYPSDCLRLWEEVSDYQSNVGAITRFMNTIEQILPIHYIRHLADNFLPSLGSMAFFSDGPLAVFGPPAWLHASIMQYLAKINVQLKKQNLLPIIIIGLQKTGQVVDHVNLINRYISNNSLFAIDDDYRYSYIVSTRDHPPKGFGYESYYGQDFIYKTATGKNFVFALPYPFASKTEPNLQEFISGKTQLDRYPELNTALALINHFESDLYENAIIPIALAHRYTAISLEPGGKVLDILTRHALNK